MSEEAKPKPYEVRSERNLFEYIKIFEAGEWDHSRKLIFIDWPKCEIRVRGEKFDGGCPTRIMPAFIALQHEIDRGYSRCVYGKVQPLTKKEKREIELTVRFEPGCTIFGLDIISPLNTVVKKMDGKQTVIVILVVAGMAFSHLTITEYMRTQAEMHGRQVDAAMLQTVGEHGVQHANILAAVASKYPTIAEQHKDVYKTNQLIIKGLDDNDELVIGGVPIITGKLARQIIRKPSERRVSSRLDGNFIILSIASDGVHEGFQMPLRHVQTGEKLSISIPAGTIPDDKITEIRNAEWNKQQIYLQVNVVRIGDRIVESSLVSAE